MQQRAQRAVDEVAGHEQHVAALAVEHRHPAVEVGAAVVVAQMQVAHGQHLHGVIHLALGVDGQLHTPLVLVV